MGSTNFFRFNLRSPAGTLYLTGFLALLTLLVSALPVHAEWTHTNGPIGARVRTFTVNGTTVLAGTMAGVFRSTNAGTTWLDAGMPTGDVHALSFDGVTIHAGTPAGVFSSTDNGATWHAAGLPYYDVTSLARSGSNLYAGTYGEGVFLSRDAGATWTGMSAGLPDSMVTCLLPYGNALLAGTAGGFIYRTTNFGSSWTDVSSQLTSVYEVNTIVARGSTLFAGTSDGVWRSTDSASTWIQVGLSGGIITSIAPVAGSATLFAATYGGLFKSINDGSTWAPSSSGMTNTNVNAVSAFGSTVLAGTSSSGVYVSTNSGSSWAESNNGMVGQYTWSLAATPPTGPKVLFGGTSNGVSVSLDDGASWLALDVGMPYLAAYALLLSDTTLFAGTNGAGVFRGTLSALTWTPVSIGLPAGAAVRSLARIPPVGGTNPTLYAGLENNGVYFSTNMGSSWSSASIGLPSASTVYGLLAVQGTGGTTLYAGLYGDGVFKSTNNGSSWTAANNGIPAYTTVCSFAASGTSIYAGTIGAGVYLSTNEGATWLAVNTGLPTYAFVYSLTVAGGTVYAGCDGGVYSTTNNGTGWSVEGSALLGHAVLSMAASGTSVYAGTTRGVWTQVKLSYPTTYALSTTIQFPQHTSISAFTTTDYRLVGLPGNPNTSVSAYLPGKSEADWRVSWDNGGSSNFLIRYDGSAAFNFTTGRAFWMINNGPVTIAATVPTATLNASSEVEIPLHSGWNLITDPFSGGVAWSTVQMLNGVTEPIFQYNGTSTYLTTASLSPYTGCYFYNATGASVLRIPLSAAGLVPVGREADPAAWRVQVRASDGEGVDSLASFGVFAGPAARAKALSYHKPRPLADAVSVSFPRPDLDAKFPAYAADIRPVFESIQEWPIELTAVQGRAASLSFSGLERVPADFEVWLIDAQTGRAFDLRKDSVYRFTPPLGQSKFSAVIGRHGAVEARLAAGLPTAFALGRNFPNPFNPSTTIPVEVPQQTEASLKIYSLLGAEVAVLHQGRLEAGRYWFTWDGLDHSGRSAATGTYLVRMQAGGKSFVSKILLLR